MGQGAGAVVVVDDEPFILDMLATLLKSRGFEVRTFDSGEGALAAVQERPADLLLTDVNMPRMNGISMVTRFRAFDPDTPVIFMTAAAEAETAISALRLRASDLILKPFPPLQLVVAAQKAVAEKRALLQDRRWQAELARVAIDDTCQLVEAIKRQHSMSLEIIQRLTAAARLHNEETGEHISRIGSYAAIISRSLGLPEEFCATISVAATMHDIGKLGIPDSILLKPAPLTPGEFEVIKGHTVIGEQLLAGSRHPMLQMAATIALSHHEKWDGSGYPFGLSGDTIPLPGRIVMIADQYDALRSRRAYKTPLDHERACEAITMGEGGTTPRHFDPSILRAFRETAELFRETFAAQSAPGRPWSPPHLFSAA